jgi:hypothetical protein
MRLIALLSISSILAGCADLGVKPPNTDWMHVNAPGKRLRGYNLATDYDADGNRLPGAKAIVTPVSSLDDLNGWACTNPDGEAEIKRAYQQMKAKVADLNARLQSCQRGGQ